MHPQTEAVLAALLPGQPKTALDLLHEAGTLRAGARVFELRELGHRIEVEYLPADGRKRPHYRLITGRS